MNIPNVGLDSECLVPLAQRAVVLRVLNQMAILAHPRWSKIWDCSSLLVWSRIGYTNSRVRTPQEDRFGWTTGLCILFIFLSWENVKQVARLTVFGWRRTLCICGKEQHWIHNLRSAMAMLHHSSCDKTTEGSSITGSCHPNCVSKKTSYKT